MQLEEAVMTRHSSRDFLPTEVPQAVLDRALELARHSPSNSNTQVWRLFVVRGLALERLRTKLYETAAAASPLSASQSATLSSLPGEPDHPATVLPPSLQHYRTELGAQIYGAPGLGLAREDMAGRREAVLRNFSFFGAPVALVVCMSAELRGQAALCVGLYLQTLLLAVTEAGVGSCVQIAVAGYPNVLRAELDIPDHLDILCGISIGYENPDARINRCRSDREPVGKTTIWVDE